MAGSPAKETAEAARAMVSGQFCTCPGETVLITGDSGTDMQAVDAVLAAASAAGARPLLCVAMVLLAATVSLRSFRSGGIQTMVGTGMIGGFGFFLASEISRQIGVAGLAPAWASVWLPVILLLVISTTVLLHQEDG